MSCKYCHESMPLKPKDEFCGETCRENQNSKNVVFGLRILENAKNMKVNVKEVVNKLKE